MKTLIVVLFSLGVCTAKAQDGILAGRVTDWVTNAGIGDATLEATDAYGHNFSTLTKADGTYDLRKLPRAIELKVSCSQIGYTPYPKVAELKITAKRAEWDAKLFPQSASNEYWKKAAQKLAKEKELDDARLFAENASAEALGAVSEELRRLAPDSRPVAVLALAYESRVNRLAIVRGPAGTRQIVETRPDNARIVVEGKNRGYVQRSYASAGRTYSSRTYYANGVPNSQLFHVYDYRGQNFHEYIPSVYYPESFYDWVSSPWEAPAEYRWDSSASPWLGHYAGYFSPYPAYPSGSFWLTDFLLASALRDAYQTSGSAERAAQDAPSKNSTELTADVKSQILEEVQRQVTSEAKQSEREALGKESDPSSNGIARMLADSSSRVLVASTPLSAVAQGLECTITAGDVLQLEERQADPAATTVTLRVLASKGEDCRPGDLVPLSLQDVQDMQNHMRASIDRGLAELRARPSKSGLPQPPASAGTLIVPAYASAAPPPDHAVAKEIARLASAVDDAETIDLQQGVIAQPPAEQAAIAAPPPYPALKPAAISLGQTVEEVKSALGQPMTIVVAGAKTIYTYKDIKVTFLNGKVTAVQ